MLAIIKMVNLTFAVLATTAVATKTTAKSATATEITPDTSLIRNFPPIPVTMAATARITTTQRAVFESIFSSPHSKDHTQLQQRTGEGQCLNLNRFRERSQSFYLPPPSSNTNLHFNWNAKFSHVFHGIFYKFNNFVFQTFFYFQNQFIVHLQY